MRHLFHQTSHMSRWRDCAIASIAFVAVASTLHFTTTASTAPFAARALSSLAFSAMTFAAGLVFGVLVWGGWRLFAGQETLEMKDTVLWAAALFGVICVGFAVLS